MEQNVDGVNPLEVEGGFSGGRGSGGRGGRGNFGGEYGEWQSTRHSPSSILGVRNTIFPTDWSGLDIGDGFGGTFGSCNGNSPDNLAVRDSEGTHLRGELREEMLTEICTKQLGDKSITDDSNGNVEAIVVDMERDSC